MENRYRPRRTCLSVPGSSEKMIQKAKTLAADEVQRREQFVLLDEQQVDGRGQGRDGPPLDEQVGDVRLRVGGDHGADFELDGAHGRQLLRYRVTSR